MNIQHPWIDEGLDTEEFECVLVATNPLPEWDAGGTMRAFQTYLWSSAPAGNDRVSFVHDETGVIVCHEGNVVGIECGHGSLSEALPDLILALHALGWQGAAVFARALLMQEILADVARSVPANLQQFDVCEGTRGAPVGELPEAQILFDHGRDMVRAAAGATDGTADGDGTTIGDMLSALGNFDDQAPMPPVNSDSAPIVLADDEDEVEVGEGLEWAMGGLPIAEGAQDSDSAVLQGSMLSQDAISTSSDDDEEGAPRVFEFFAAREMDAAVEAAPIVEHVKSAPAPIAAPYAPPRASQVAPQLDSDVPGLGHAAVKQDEAKQTQAKREQTQLTPQYGEVLRVGRSVFYFTDPSSGLSKEAFAILAKETGFTANQTLHLWPGAVNQTTRWNVVGEIDPAYPLGAETWAQWAFPDSQATVTVAEAVLRLRAAAPTCGLREVGVEMKTDAAVQKTLAALSLVPHGQAFVDLPPAAEEAHDGEHYVFTVRETMQGNVERLFIVHADSMDGAFVQWAIRLLRQVVAGYTTSDWYLQQAGSGEEQNAAMSHSNALSKNVASLLGDFFAKLEELGIDAGTIVPKQSRH